MICHPSPLHSPLPSSFLYAFSLVYSCSLPFIPLLVCSVLQDSFSSLFAFVCLFLPSFLPFFLSFLTFFLLFLPFLLYLLISPFLSIHPFLCLTSHCSFHPRHTHPLHQPRLQRFCFEIRLFSAELDSRDL